MVTQSKQLYRYRLNSDDVIEFVDRWWLAFAKENNAIGLNENSVIGHALWEFIADKPTEMLYREIHDRVRSTGNPIVVPFRCDSPTLRRHMQLTISMLVEGQLLYESELLRATPQPRSTLRESNRLRPDAILTLCSFCKRSLVEPAGWLEMENISLTLRMHDHQTPELRYTVCPACSTQLQPS